LKEDRFVGFLRISKQTSSKRDKVIEVLLEEGADTMRQGGFSGKE
jgi:hypothetical protein